MLERDDMAKYTELFSEYLERGGQLPASFALIDGFEDLFKLHYCDKEIGFETEALFQMKLERTARINMPFYADRIRRLASAYYNFDVPAKVRYEIYNGVMKLGEQNGRTTQDDNLGEQNGTTTELPFDSATAAPSAKTHAEAVNNSGVGTSHNDERTDTDEHTTEHRESGYTPDEAMKAVEFLNSQIEPLIQKLLDEFKRLFMQVY